MAYDNVRLPVAVEIGAEGGPTFSTGIITMSNGQEQRTQNWSYARHSYTIGYGVSETDWQAVRAFFYARRGKARSFRFKDWTDFYAENMPVVLKPDGTFSLAQIYQDDIGFQYIRYITRVVVGTLVLKDGAGNDVTAQYTESFGRISPATNAPLFASFEFDIPVRFDVDEMVLTAETITAVSIDTLTLIEVIENSKDLNAALVPIAPTVG